MIKIDIVKAKDIAHSIRRNVREVEFAPLDKQVSIPMYAEQAESQRQLIREKYATIQENIDKAEDVNTLTSIVKSLEKQGE